MACAECMLTRDWRFRSFDRPAPFPTTSTWRRPDVVPGLPRRSRFLAKAGLVLKTRCPVGRPGQFFASAQNIFCASCRRKSRPGRSLRGRRALGRQRGAEKFDNTAEIPCSGAIIVAAGLRRRSGYGRAGGCRTPEPLLFAKVCPRGQRRHTLGKRQGVAPSAGSGRSR
jgi:hypothetical protein